MVYRNRIVYQSRLCLQYDSNYDKDFENEYDDSDDHEDSDDEYDDISNHCNDMMIVVDKMMTIMRRAYYIYHITFSCSEESGSNSNHAYVIMMMKIVMMV